MRLKLIQQNNKKKAKKQTTTPPVVPPIVVNNQLEEIEYFKAYLLPLSQKANLQKALDTYGAVRLEYGDYYNTTPIKVYSNQKLYGHPKLTRVPRIIVAAGSSNVILENLGIYDESLTLEAGAPITNCTFKSIKWCTLVVKNASVENNTFINYLGNIAVDCSTSGYFRNNKIIRQQTGGTNGLILKGNSNTPSYGNVHLWTNFLTPHGDTSELNNLQTATFVGIDAESWNYTGDGTKAMFYAQNMGNVKIASLNGGNNGTPSNFRTPVFDVDATDFSIFNKGMDFATDVISTRTNMFVLKGGASHIRKAGTVTGYDLLAYMNNGNSIFYNNAELITALVDNTIINKIKSSIISPQYIPWARPTWETIPDPLGVNWQTERVGKPDSRAYIQNLIDTNNIADLPEGIFYISAPLTLPMDKEHGITGKGTGKTIICGLTDDFPLISLTGGYTVDGSFTLAHLTLQGGNAGIYASQTSGALNIAHQLMQFVVFRNQNYGIHLYRTGGFDNNFLENLVFINCNVGFFKDPTPNSGSDETASTYIDKTVFYQNQFINCNTAISMLATRADNLNAWINCKFNGGNTALALNNQNAPIVANCDFSNYVGKYVISSNKIDVYNSNFYNNAITNATFNAASTSVEGCNFLDNSNLFSPVIYNSTNNFVVNSTVTGNVTTIIPPNQGFYPESGTYVNSNLLSNPTLSKTLVNINDGVTPIVLINEAPTPYPQLLVTQ